MSTPRTEPSRDSRPGYPRGWFAVATADELEVGVVHPMRYFGLDLVGYRTSDGAPVVLEAHCPHLGAHMGKGGQVVDDCLRCPFHAWRFDASGSCVEVPYARAIPKQAKVRSFRAIDRNGLVFVHYDPTGAEPSYEIPILAAVGDPGWTAWRHGKLRLHTHSREILENVVDRGHFAPVHKNVPVEFENEFVGHRAIQRSVGHGMGEHRHTNYRLEATYYGPGFQITEMHSVVETLMYNAHTMVDEDTVDLRFGVMIQPGSNDARFNEAYVSAYVDVLMNGFRQDARIWEHKRWRDRPVLCDGDGPILKLREWYAQYF
ncbi:MAG: Rieske 2Fe-2S domain-containing protein [Polyangiales bacterium]